ncbi:hypothetical protein O181_117980 [Austropuccinia psidii MF-1]|uniref:Uncharacterized protein n=1 Tax=Austropuccinia psidii MF-1 TaxID=1389203 RepID=A0A9Q3KBE5_9BASI|nr:hypothetical protein [Austropuccinia psidii MF-1]
MNSYLQVKKLMGLAKTEELLKVWKPMSCKGQVQQIKAWLKNQSMLSDNQKKKLAQGKDTSKNPPQPVPNKPKKTSKTNQKGKRKPKGKEQALTSELQNSQEREDSHGQCVQYGKNSEKIQK